MVEIEVEKSFYFLYFKLRGLFNVLEVVVEIKVRFVEVSLDFIIFEV